MKKCGKQNSTCNFVADGRCLIEEFKGIGTKCDYQLIEKVDSTPVKEAIEEARKYIKGVQHE